ncbi:MAG: Tetratricopeptide repeat domain protein [candidate division TM6 bacterium GW2011_GWF2_32_72]|nr:MAG: Tetratricopeptide repeat domain protein [candidate division TM6 bacterium GW2011_GWF2_32_72]
MKKFLTLLLIVTASLAISETSKESENLHRQIMANYFHLDEKYQQASQLFMKNLENNAPKEAYKDYTIHLFELGQYPAILKIKEYLKDTFDNDETIQLIFAQSLEATGKKEEAAKAYIDLAKKFKTNPEITQQAAQSLANQGKLNEALAVIDLYTQNTPHKRSHFVFEFLKSNIYLNQGKKELALDSVKKSLEIAPKFGQGWLFLAMLQEQSGQIEDAIKGYTNFLELNGSNSQIELQVANLLFKQGEKEQAQKFLLKSQANNPQIQMIKVQKLYEEKKYEQALQEIEKGLKKQPENPVLRMLKVQTLSIMQKHKDILKILKKWCLDDPQNELWFKTMHLLQRTNIAKDEIIKALLEIEKKHPENLLVNLYLADMYSRTKDFKEALKYHKQAFQLTTDARMKAKLLHHTAVLLAQDKKNNEVIDVLEKAYEIDPTYLPTTNMLAYYCATKTKNLEKAEKLITEVLKRDPNNPHFLDTKAVILFKQNKPEEALPILKTAQKNAPKDFYIAKHLAKVYNQLGEKKLAQDSMQTAISLSDNELVKKKCQKHLKTWSK